MPSYDYKQILIDTLEAARVKDYAGYSKFDALNSPFLEALSFKNPWFRFAYTQMIKISPINLRPIFHVKISRNPKGAALFARAYLSLFESTKDEKFLKEAVNLLDWLIDNRCISQRYFAWGYNYTWQDIPPFVQHKGEPATIVTIFAAETFLHGYRVTGREEYFKAARSAADFLTRSLDILHETDKEVAIAYTLGQESSIVINIQALTAALLAKIWQVSRDDDLIKLAKKMTEFVHNQKTPYNAWYYTFPAGKSPIKHDNYHTGGIVDALLEYAEITLDERAWQDYWMGLEYYKENLFETDGAPRWMNDRKYPHDVHGAAQGIISFTKAARHKSEYLIWARQIADWSINNLYRPDRRDFIYRRSRFLKYNFTLMHWCNGWMSRALGELIKDK